MPNMFLSIFWASAFKQIELLNSRHMWEREWFALTSDGIGDGEDKRTSQKKKKKYLKQK